MMKTSRQFNDSGIINVAGKDVRWSYSRRVYIAIHESTEMFICYEMFDKQRFCLHDLKNRIKGKLRGAAMAEARAKFVAELDAEERRKRLVDVQPVKALSEDLVR